MVERYIGRQLARKSTLQKYVSQKSGIRAKPNMKKFAFYTTLVFAGPIALAVYMERQNRDDDEGTPFYAEDTTRGIEN